MIDEKLKRTASRAREWCEVTNSKHKLFPRNLQGMCGIATTYLYKQLCKKGYRPTIVSNNYHSFLLCKGHVVDITATQFGFRRVEIFPYVDQLAKECNAWEPKRKFRSLESFFRSQKDWPLSQRACLFRYFGGE